MREAVSEENQVCVKCGHSGLLAYGEVCIKATGPTSNCGCHCVFTAPEKEAELLPCPFCGRKASMQRYFIDDQPEPWYVAECVICPIKTYDQTTQEEAARIWNTRTQLAGKAEIDVGRLAREAAGQIWALDENCTTAEWLDKVIVVIESVFAEKEEG